MADRLRQETMHFIKEAVLCVPDKDVSQCACFPSSFSWRNPIWCYVTTQWSQQTSNLSFSWASAFLGVLDFNPESRKNELTFFVDVFFWLCAPTRTLSICLSLPQHPVLLYFFAWCCPQSLSTHLFQCPRYSLCIAVQTFFKASGLMAGGESKAVCVWERIGVTHTTCGILRWGEWWLLLHPRGIGKGPGTSTYFWRSRGVFFQTL